MRRFIAGLAAALVLAAGAGQAAIQDTYGVQRFRAGIQTNTIGEAGTAQGVTVDGLLLKDGTARSAVGVGAAANGAVATEYGAGVFRQTVLQLTAKAVTLTDDGANGHATVKLYDFPAGFVTVLSTVSNLSCTSAGTMGATPTLTFSAGTAATADVTLNGAEVTYLASTSTGAFVASAGAMAAGSTATERTTTDGHSSAADFVWNIGIATDPGADSIVTCTGPVTVTWFNGGDN